MPSIIFNTRTQLHARNTSLSKGGGNECLVVDCGRRNLSFVPSLPGGATKLDLQNNPNLGSLSPFEPLTTALSVHSESITWLYIQSAPITDLQENTFASMQSLETLEISLTSLTEIRRHAINPGGSLKTLTFADNKITRFAPGVFQSDLASVQNLKFLNMSEFAYAEGQFANMASLQVFTANNCGGIEQLPARLFEGSNKLQSITFEMNFGVREIVQGCFRGAHSVTHLRLMELRSLTSLATAGGSQSVLEGLTGLTDLTIASGVGGVAEITVGSFEGQSRSRCITYAHQSTNQNVLADAGRGRTYTTCPRTTH